MVSEGKGQKPTSLDFFSLKNDQILATHGQIYLKSHFSRGKGAEGYVYALKG